MSWMPTEQEVQALLLLSGPKRYEYCIKKIADQEQLWSLWQEGWALAADDAGREVVPIWPHSLYATLCATGRWSKYTPKAIDLLEWKERWTPGMDNDKRLVAVFPTPRDKGVVIAARRFQNDLDNECAKYEE